MTGPPYDLGAIEEGLAVSVAGQVAVGLMRGDDDELVRARVALLAIGLMVRNAVPENSPVHEILDFADTGEIRYRP